MLKRRIEDLAVHEEAASKKMKEHQEAVQRLTQELRAQQDAVELLRMSVEDCQTLLDMRRKEMAKMDADKLFQDLPTESPNQPKPVAPKSSRHSSRSIVIDPSASNKVPDTETNGNHK